MSRSCVRRVAARLSLHFGLGVAVIAYCLLGALLFNGLEEEYEADNWVDVSAMRLELLSALYRLAALEHDERPDAFTLDASDLMWRYETTLLNGRIGNYNSNGVFAVHRDWSFEHAFYYSFAIISTLGYGVVTPTSVYGQLATLGYAIVGIPLFVVFVATGGAALARQLQALCGACRLCRRRGSNVKSVASTLDDDEEKNAAATLPVATILVQEEEEKQVALLCPLLLSLTMLSGYVALGASLFSASFDWSFVESLHLVVVCLTTIGYGELLDGDTAPEPTPYCFVYLLFGYVIVGSVANLLYKSLVTAAGNVAKHFGQKN